MKVTLKRNQILIWSGVILLVFGAGFLLGNDFGESQCPVCAPQDIDLSLFWETYNLLFEKFVDHEKLNNQKLIEGAIFGMVESLEDPYTTFLTPENTKKFIEEITGRFEGLGMEIGKRKGELQVIAPLEGTPAQKAGLRAGDKII